MPHSASTHNTTPKQPQKIAIAFEHVSVSLGGVNILDDISASVPQGGCTAIVGPNGAGKTTLLKALLGEIPYQGTIQAYRSGSTHRIGYVPQRLPFDRGLPLKVYEFLIMGKQRRPFWLGINKKYKKEAIDLLASVHAEGLANRSLGALSGGELQRVLLALALQQKPNLLILDEPTANVDVRGEYLFCELLERLRKELTFTQLMVSHDLPTVTHHATHVILLNRELVDQGPPQNVLTLENLSAVFGIHMGLTDARAFPDGRPTSRCSVCERSDPHA